MTDRWVSPSAGRQRWRQLQIGVRLCQRVVQVGELNALDQRVPGDAGQVLETPQHANIDGLGGELHGRDRGDGVLSQEGQQHVDLLRGLGDGVGEGGNLTGSFSTFDHATRRCGPERLAAANGGDMRIRLIKKLFCAGVRFVSFLDERVDIKRGFSRSGFIRGRAEEFERGHTTWV